jgi:hypothetical protein
VTFKGGNEWVKPLLQTVGPWSSNVEYFVTFKGGNEWVNCAEREAVLRVFIFIS